MREEEKERGEGREEEKKGRGEQILMTGWIQEETSKGAT